jgi:gamma-glutamyltranspeptidase/glutathione hydrolase
MARFHHSQVSNRLDLELNLYALVGKDLAGMGHNVNPVSGGSAGGTGAPAVHGYYRAGSDHRKDGQAVGR